MTYEEFIKVYNEAANDDATHASLPAGGSANTHALFTALTAFWEDQATKPPVEVKTGARDDKRAKPAG